jgi:hypothetical protein
MHIKEKYRLELRWDKIIKEKDDVCRIEGAYFTGPVMAEVNEIQPNDRIVLDVTPQFSTIITSYYFMTLYWKDVRYLDSNVYLGDVTIQGDFVSSFSGLDSKSHIDIDTENHEESVHIYNLVYKARLMDKNGKEVRYA